MHFLCVIALLAPPAAESVTIRLNRPASGPATVDVAGLGDEALKNLAAKRSADEWAAVLAVRVGDGATPLLGSYRVEGGVLRFEPRFPLAAGLRYRATFRADAKAEPVVADLMIPRPKVAPTTVVQQVYPSAERLPENALKFYLHFSAPMSRGEAYKHVRLVRGDGVVVDRPFLEVDEELWDPDCRRLTLLVYPGRVKRGLKPREEEGPVFEEGKRYTLQVAADWKDAAGEPLKQAFQKTYTVGAPDDTPPDQTNWKLTPPAAGGSDPLRVRFPEPLDHALLNRLLRVTDAAGNRLPGTVSVAEGETEWRFVPEKPWRAGAYKLVIDTRLEDRSGNRVGRKFEVDVFDKVDASDKPETVERPFEVKASP
jgi:hypothetical protein